MGDRNGAADDEVVVVPWRHFEQIFAGCRVFRACWGPRRHKFHFIYSTCSSTSTVQLVFVTVVTVIVAFGAKLASQLVVV